MAITNLNFSFFLALSTVILVQDMVQSKVISPSSNALQGGSQTIDQQLEGSQVHDKMESKREENFDLEKADEDNAKERKDDLTEVR